MPFRNLAREYSTTTGTSNCVLSGAVPGCNTWELAGIANGETVRYGIITYSLTSNRPTHSEVGVGTYDTATNTLTRATVESSTNAGAKITLTGLSEVYICTTAADMNALAAYTQNGAATVIADGANAFLDIDTERVDHGGMCSLSGGNTITFAAVGYYDVGIRVQVESTSSDNLGDGYIYLAPGGTAGVVLSYDYRGFTTAMGMVSASLKTGGTVPVTAAAQTLKVAVYNESGVSIDAYVLDITIKRVANYP